MRLLVVSRSPMMAMTLRAESFDVLDLRPPRFSDWLNSTDDEVDALVLDLSDPRVALQAVIELRARARMFPALLVSGEQEGWDDLAVRDLPAARVLPLPVTRPALLSALSDLLAEQEPTPEGTPESESDVAITAAELPPAGPEVGNEPDLEVEPPTRQQEAARLVGPPQATSTEPATPAATAVALPADPSAVAAVAVPLAAPLVPETTDRQLKDQQSASTHETTVAPPVQPEPVPAVQRVNESERTNSPARSPAPTTPALPPMVPAPPPPEPASPPAPPRVRVTPPAEIGPGQLVKLLQERLPDLISVGEVADVVIADAVERVKAEAGALLVPDGERWRVSGGVGLRALEQRLELDEGSWLVTEVAHAGQGVIVEDSDIARNPLKGAPLASWRHILLAPIALVEAILVLARSDDPFDESDLTHLVSLSKEAGPLLQTAIETRALARSLVAFTDSDPG